MSQLLAPTHTLVDAIPLGRRIAEIMHEKGSAYTISAMAKRLEINRETLRLMLKGEREIYTFELDNISKDLKIPVERIMQTDIEEITRELRTHLDIGSNTSRCLELSAQMTEIAIGLTERVIVANERARGYYQARDMKLAIETLQNILPDAELIFDKYGEPDIWMWVIGNLISAKTIEGQYENVSEMAAQVEPYFDRNPKLAAIVCYCVAQDKLERVGDFAGAREKHYQSLHYYEQHGVPISVANSQLNVAIFEERQRRFEEARGLFKSSLGVFRTHDNVYAQAVHAREYGKMLIRLGEMEEATEVLEWVFAHAQPGLLQEEMEAQLYLLLTIAKADLSHAERVLEHQIGSVSIQKLAYKRISDHYAEIGDLEAQVQSAQRYLIKRSSPIDLVLNVSNGTHYLLTLFDFCIRHRWN